MSDQPVSSANLVAGQWGTILIHLFVRGAGAEVREALVESLRVPGARTSARLAPWIKDTPELKLNLLLLVEAFLQLLASWLGTLALVWATVVLLGGFSTMLGRTDFWFITGIVFVETARIVGYNSAPEARFFVDLPGVLSQKDISRVGMASIKFVRIVTMGPTWVALAPIFIATACMSLSTIRLVGIGRHAYGGSASNGNLKPALILFYALVLTQGALFLVWFAVAVIRSREAAELSSLYDLSPDLIERYVGSIAATCIEKGVATTINTNLVSFAAELLLQSQHPDDHTFAVSVLHLLLLVIENKKRSDQAVKQICSSEKLVYRLVRMLCSDELDADIKEKNAKIVAQLACKLHLADIPGAAHCISSLLDPHLMKKAAQTSARNDSRIIWWRLEIKGPLFLHGLVILRELATDPDNCREIYSTMDLVPKIIAPVSNGLHIVIKDDETTVEIVRESLSVLEKLTSGTSDSSRKLCHELTTKYGRTAENIIWILNNSKDEGMGMLAVKILSRLTLDEPRMLQLTAELQSLLFASKDIRLRIEAGKALIARGDEFPDIQQLVTIMSADDYSKEHRAVTAEMLAQLCARSRADQDRFSRLSAVANALSTVLKAILTETTDITVTETGIINRKFLASLLGLAVQIREKLVTPEAFVDAVTGLPMGNNIFAEKLKLIIEKANDDSEDEICLAIMKSATKLVMWVTEIDTAISPAYLEYFRRVKIVQRLDTAVKAMAHLDMFVVMTGGADEKEDYVTLQTLVETAKNKLVPQQHQS